VEHLPHTARKPATKFAVDTLLSPEPSACRRPSWSQTNADIRRDSELATLSSADLYRRLRPRVKHLVMCLLGGRTAPDDLVHDVCAEIVTSEGHFQNESEFGSWVNAVVRRQVYMWLRGQQRYHRLLRDLSEGTIARAPPPPDESLEATRRLRRTAEALNSLPGPQKACLLLLTLEGVSVPEAARRLGTTAAAVRTAVCRTRARLRQVLTTTESAGTTARGQRGNRIE
jgi:RNA polymerase sigma-70 factor (ECF subfamily)